MTNDRDYSAVQTPVLSFLIAHELFRLQPAEMFCAQVKPVKKVPRCNYAKRKVTLRARMHAQWEKIFGQLKNRASTSQLAALSDRGNVSVGHAMRALEEDGVVVRDGKIPHSRNGRDQIIWKWVK